MLRQRALQCGKFQNSSHTPNRDLTFTSQDREIRYSPSTRPIAQLSRTYLVSLLNTVCPGSRSSTILGDPFTLSNLALPESISLLGDVVEYVMYFLLPVVLMGSFLSSSTHSLERLCDRGWKDAAGKVATRALPIG